MNKKTQIKVFLIATLALFGATYSYAGAGDDHTHGEQGHEHVKKVGGPNGGRMITSVDPHIEFFVTSERVVQVSFINQKGDVVKAEDQELTLIGGGRGAPVSVKFIKKGDMLLSDAALPEMKNMPIILSIKPAADAQIVRERFYLNMSDCSGCEYEEYACVCGH